jgi:hypothetical protein
MKNLARGRFLSAWSLGCLLVLTACSGNHEDTIVGKWAHRDEGTVTFTADGHVIDQEGGRTDKGEYSFSNNTLTLKLDAVSNAYKFTVSFPHRDELLLTVQPNPFAAPTPGSRSALGFTRVSR